MDNINQNLWNKAIQFLKDCSNTKTHIIHDFDTDGVSGGLILLHTLENLNCKASASTRKSRGASLHVEELKKIKELNPDRIIITDQDPKSYEAWDDVKRIFPDTPILIIDHHFVTDYDDALFIHPQHIFGIDGADYCSSKLIFDLCSEITDTSNLAWLACAGILGDANSRQFADFLRQTAEKEGYTIPVDPYDYVFAKIGLAIDCATAVGEEPLLEYIEALKPAITLKEGLAVDNPHPEVAGAVDQIVEDAIKQAEGKQIVWVNTEHKYNIGSWALTIASMQKRSICFIGFRPDGDGYAVSLRWQDTPVHLGKIVKVVAGNLGGRGGGHAPAAGSFVPREHFNQFCEDLESMIQKNIEEKV